MKKIGFFEKVISTVYPPKCPFCSNTAEYGLPTCESCNNLTAHSAILSKTSNDLLCACAFPYADVYRKSVLTLKFNNTPQNSDGLGKLLFTAVKANFCGYNFDIVTSVPLHKDRQLERGYNQAELIAKSTARCLNKKYLNLLEKPVSNLPQHTLSAAERAENIKNVYRVRKKAPVCDKRILLIDDIITTGNTLGECAKILIDAGAAEVICAAVCARTFSEAYGD